jgi:hypothetical protein
MTEAEWLVSTDPAAMLRWLQGFNEPQSKTYTGRKKCVSDRKLRLFACACEPTFEAWDRLDVSHEIDWLASAQNQVTPVAANFLRCIFGPPTRNAAARPPCAGMLGNRSHPRHGLSNEPTDPKQMKGQLSAHVCPAIVTLPF